MKEKFMMPVMDVIILAREDVIRTSQEIPEIGDDDVAFEPT